MTDRMKITPIEQHPGMSIPTDNPKMADKEKKKSSPTPRQAQASFLRAK